MMHRIWPMLGLLVAITPACAETGIFLPPEQQTTGIALEHSVQTGLHAAYTEYGGYGSVLSGGVLYAQCDAGDCMDRANWQTSKLPVEKAAKVQLALTPEGQPRLLIEGNMSEQTYGDEWIFAECDSDCLEADNWQMGTIALSHDINMTALRFQQAEHSFALDNEGRPRFAMPDTNYQREPDHTGLFYMACDLDCTIAENWSETNLTSADPALADTFEQPALAFDMDGNPRVVARVNVAAGGGELSAIYFYHCDRDCRIADNWDWVRLPETRLEQNTHIGLDLEISAGGEPRLAMFIDQQELSYAWCVNDCRTEGDWQRTVLVREADDGVGLALSPEGLPHIAFKTEYGGLGYATCLAECDVAGAGQWLVSAGDQIGTSVDNPPFAQPDGCDPAAWQVDAPGIAFDGEHAIIGHDLRAQVRCPVIDEAGEHVATDWPEPWRGVRLNAF